MSNQYAPMTPVGKNGIPKVGYVPAKVALASQNRENASASSILLLTHDTTEVEISPLAVAVAGKWLTQAVVDSSVAGTSVITAFNTANFDFVVPANDSRRFVVPIATIPTSFSSVQGVNRGEGLYPALAIKSMVGASSVLLAQY